MFAKKKKDVGKGKEKRKEVSGRLDQLEKNTESLRKTINFMETLDENDAVQRRILLALVPIVKKMYEENEAEHKAIGSVL